MTPNHAGPRAERPAFSSGGVAFDGGRRDGRGRGGGDRGPGGERGFDRAAPAAAGSSGQPVQPWVRRGDAWTPERQVGQARSDWRRDGGRPDGRRDDARPAGDRSGADAVRRWQDHRDGRGDANHWQAGFGAGGDRRFDDRRFDDRRGDGRLDWNRNWHGDRRYDWSGYRQGNRGLYRLPRYYAPYDWQYGYRRFSIGATLFAGLWDQGYWIDDPYEYRLPPAYGPYRWVRYYNDALLVDIETGEVVDTVYDIFY